MPRCLSILILLGMIAAAQAQGAEEKSKSGSKIENTVEKTGAALGRTADRVEKSVRKAGAATAKAIDTAGKKTGEWLNEKTK